MRNWAHGRSASRALGSQRGFRARVMPVRVRVVYEGDQKIRKLRLGEGEGAGGRGVIYLYLPLRRRPLTADVRTNNKIKDIPINK